MFVHLCLWVHMYLCGVYVCVPVCYMCVSVCWEDESVRVGWITHWLKYKGSALVISLIVAIMSDSSMGCSCFVLLVLDSSALVDHPGTKFKTLLSHYPRLHEAFILASGKEIEEHWESVGDVWPDQEPCFSSSFIPLVPCQPCDHTLLQGGLAKGACPGDTRKGGSSVATGPFFRAF